MNNKTLHQESKMDIEHNQCDICFKKFPTAVGFHRHYPNCVEKHSNCNHIFRLHKGFKRYEIQKCRICSLKRRFDY